MEVQGVSGGELELSFNLGPVGVSGSIDDFGQAAQTYGKFMPFSGIAYIGDLYGYYKMMSK